MVHFCMTGFQKTFIPVLRRLVLYKVVRFFICMRKLYHRKVCVIPANRKKNNKKYITMCLHDYIFHEYTSQVSLVSSIQSHFIALEFISSCLWFQISDWNSYSSMTKPRQHPCYHYLPPPLVHYLYQRTCGQELDEKGNIGRLRREAISAVSPFSSFDSD